ncbi:MAG: hypothetical protein LBP35_04530 [Candidatus Ancillula trichonymphae]|nr:hypothetical protein [Candidatus Ancillula trichonymphae]
MPESAAAEPNGAVAETPSGAQTSVAESAVTQQVGGPVFGVQLDENGEVTIEGVTYKINQDTHGC